MRAFAVERYIEPPEDNALSWARMAGEQGDPEAPAIEQQILSRMAQKVQQARAVRNYDLSVALLTKLAALYPDHPELQRLCIAAQQERQEYAREVQRQQQQQRR
jgi:TPR repeat protein